MLSVDNLRDAGPTQPRFAPPRSRSPASLRCGGTAFFEPFSLPDNNAGNSNAGEL
jgi:hypothetical protein